MSGVPKIGAPRTLEGLKRLAKKHKRETGCRHSEALDAVARVNGWQNYEHARRWLVEDDA